MKTKDEALDVISHQSEFKEDSKPDVISLDWNLSHETSEEVVTAGKPGDFTIPVVVMTGSDPERSVLEASVSQVDMHIQKPTGRDGFIKLLRSLLSDE